ncbi:DNA methyltransferase [Natrononativus amylolyticus]|uniref:DNA methyltransferase n=1 Tax=Natrononativus amylolyticus TaxID=2963434 RepID=UPI0020CE123A|nr:DNA methyltransferase [Natrononativus amylolyticus]
MSDDLTLEDLPQPEYEGTVSVDDLDVDGENPNEMSEEQFGLLVDRMRSEGWLGGPILTTTDGVIADGEHRWRAAQELGLSEVPVRQFNIDEPTRRLWRQEMNKNQGEHDRKRDALEYDYLLHEGKSDEVHELTQAASEDLDELLAEIKLQAERPPEYEYNPDHNVYFEDCITGIREHLEDNSIDCVITDPPYGIDWQSFRREQEFDAIASDESVGEAAALFREVCRELDRVCREGASLFICTRWDVYPEFLEVTNAFFEVHNCLVWVKNNHGLGDLTGGFAPKHEFIIYASVGKREPLNDRDDDVLEFDRVNTTEYTHPTEKPVPLFSHLTQLATDPGDMILDPFMGSGTTAVAAIQSDRDYVGFELDEENYRTPIERRIGEAKRAREASVNQEC